jgi:hypothetical protein
MVEAGHRELVEENNCAKLKHPFFRNLEFGTHGMCSSTTTKTVTKAERGHSASFDAFEQATISSAYISTI